MRNYYMYKRRNWTSISWKALIGTIMFEEQRGISTIEVYLVISLALVPSFYVAQKMCSSRGTLLISSN